MRIPPTKKETIVPPTANTERLTTHRQKTNETKGIEHNPVSQSRKSETNAATKTPASTKTGITIFIT